MITRRWTLNIQSLRYVLFVTGNAEDSDDLYLEKLSTEDGVTNECNNNNNYESNVDCARDETTACENSVNQNFVGVAYDYGTFPKILAVHSIKPDEMKMMQKTPQTMPPQLPLSPRSNLTGCTQPQVEPPLLSPRGFHPQQGPPPFLQRQYRPPQLSPPHFTQSQYPLNVNPPMNSPPQFRQQQAMHPQYRQMMLIEEAKRMEIRRRQATLQQLQATLEHKRFVQQQQRNMTVANTVPGEAVTPQMHGLPLSHQRNYSQEGLSNGPLSAYSQEQNSSHRHTNVINGYQVPTMSAMFENRQVNNVHYSNLAVKQRVDGFSQDNDLSNSHLSSPKRSRFANGVFHERPTTPVDFPLTQISSPGHRYPQFLPRNNMYHERMTGIESPYLYQSSVPPLLTFEHGLREQSVQDKVLQDYQNRIRHGRRLPQHEYDNYIRLLKKQQQRQQQPVPSDQIGGNVAVKDLSRIPGNIQEWIHGTRPEGLPGTVPNRFPQDITNMIPAHPEQINPGSTANGYSVNIPERIQDDVSGRNPRFIPGCIPGKRRSRSLEVNGDGQGRMQGQIQERIPENAAGEYLMNESSSMPMNVFMDDASVERLMLQGNHQVKDAVEHYNRLNGGVFNRQKSSDSCDKCVDSVNDDVCTQENAVEAVSNDHEGPPLKTCRLEEHNDSRKDLTNESVISMNSTKTMSLEFRISASDLSRLLLIENKRELLRTLKSAAKISQRILAIVVERLLEKRVLANALILLDHLKLSDLTEIVKERVLSVVREIVWGDAPRLDLWQEKKKDQGYKDTTEFHHDLHVIQISDNEVDDNETIENEDRENEVYENGLKEDDVTENMVSGNEVSDKDVTGNDEVTASSTAYESRKELSDNVETLQSSNQEFQSFKDHSAKQVEVSSATKEVADVRAVVSKVAILNAERHTITLNDISYKECFDTKTEIVDECARKMHSQTVDEALVNIKQEPTQHGEYNACCHGKETDTARNHDVKNSGCREQVAKKRNESGIYVNTDNTERVIKEQGETDCVTVTEMSNGCKGIGSEDYVTVKLEPVHDIPANVYSFNNSSRSKNSFDWTTFTVKEEQEVDGNVYGVTPVRNDEQMAQSRTESLRKDTVIDEYRKERDRYSNSFDPLKNNNFLPESELETLGNVTIYWDGLGNIDIKEEDGTSRKDTFELDCKRKSVENCSIREEITEKDCQQDHEGSIVGNVFDLFR